MGYFFRRSSKIGPFRLNYSKSGIGASVGVKSARLTITPRGTIYVTIGSHGFYYRETLPRPGSIHVSNSPVFAPPHVGDPGDAISNASASDLVDSSNEKLIQHLNERAKMFNPAWILYVAAAITLTGFTMLPSIPTLPTLPDVTLPFSSDRRGSTTDEYSMLTARYGQPTSIHYTVADPLAPVPVGTADYSTVHLGVVFVPNGCVAAYEQVTKVLDDRSRHQASAKAKMKNVTQCVPSPDAGWTTIRYVDSAENLALSAEIAAARLDRMTVKQVSSPVVEGPAGISENKQRLNSRSVAKKAPPQRLEMKSNDQSRLELARLRVKIEAAEREVLYFSSALAVGAFGLFCAGVFVHKRNAKGRTSRLFYELDEAERHKYGIVDSAWATLAQSHRIWRIEAESTTYDWKRNAGASSLVRRVPITVVYSKPQRVETNVAVPCINIGQVKLYFLPDVILYWERGTFGAIAYHDFRVDQGFTRFIEDESVPADATVVDRTWRYVNKDGGPDRRFNNNLQLPVVQYGVLILASSGGLNIHLNTSNAQLSLAVANCWRSFFSCLREQLERRSTDQSAIPMLSGAQVQALKMLGLSANASESEVSTAYHHLAQMYHPDKVVGLAAEFQVLADRRMKEINAAYESLKGRGSTTPTV